MLELKINRKRKENGEDPINIHKECAKDLKDRKKDQYELF